MRRHDQPEEFTQMLRESMSELQTEEQIAPLDLKFPPEVTHTLEEFTQKHFVDPAKLIPLAMKAHIDRMDLVGEDVNRLMRDPATFDWPLEDPILCVTIASCESSPIDGPIKCTKDLGLRKSSSTRLTGGKAPDRCLVPE